MTCVPPPNAPEDSHDADRLTSQVTRLLREQPLRRAPEVLSIRVLQAIEQRQRYSWRTGLQRWPLPIRVTFMALSVLAAMVAVELSRWLLQSMDTSRVSVPRPPLLSALADAVLTIARQVPDTWQYGVIAILILVYGGLFGLGTAVYRVFYTQR